MPELGKRYEPHAVEDRWYSYWLKKNYFHATLDPKKKPYSIVIPPPNVTGSLHMGHAFNNTLQDILVRWRRMHGDDVLWMPGTDHAGIATQNVVERQLKKQGLFRDDIGREKFVERVWNWREESGGVIIDQLKRLGASCDWDRERFTMDKGLSKAVKEVFVRLYKEDLIYQGNYIINWCPRCRTALSDIEVEYQDLPGKFYHIKYPYDGGFIVVATTRPETMLGDTAVAVHPDDERYQELIGKDVILPVIGRKLKVIADTYVDPEFGTGVVKITPAHDPNDFLVGKRHNLEEVNVMNEDGTMNEKAGPYAGQDRFLCRKNLLKQLEAEGLLLKVDDHDHSVGHCYRCQTVVEPYLSKQWFVAMESLAKPALEAVRTGKVKFVPKNWEKTYYEWLENIRDWCISRQIWWGHRIPVWYCKDCDHLTVSVEDVYECEKCNSKNIEQETDVLDTWFSSALWPFSTLGWPEETAELKKYYPTNVLVTGFDILFFWVARMIMMGLKFMDEIPFDTVYIHALVRDEQGRKMSKSLGNAIDPLVMIDKYGTDAFRFTLTAFAAQGRDVSLSEKRIEGYRNFCNKIWNATRFIMMNLGDFKWREFKVGFFEKNKDGKFVPSTIYKETIMINTATKKETKVEPYELKLADRWILSRMNQTVVAVDLALEEFRFNEAAHLLYDFIWHEFCDWYIEMVKERLLEKNTPTCKAALWTLTFVLEKTMQALHPIMPFITEEIWQHLNPGGGSIMISRYPSLKIEEFLINKQVENEMSFVSEKAKNNKCLVSEKAELEISLVQNIITKVRNLRSEMSVPLKAEIKLLVKNADNDRKEIINQALANIKSLARVEDVEYLNAEQSKPAKSASIIVENMEIFVPLGEVIDFEVERERHLKEIAKIDDFLERTQKKLTNQKFVDNAPAAVVEQERAKLETNKEIKAKLQENLAQLQ